MQGEQETHNSDTTTDDDRAHDTLLHPALHLLLVILRYPDSLHGTIKKGTSTRNHGRNDYDNNCDALHLAEAIRAACLTAALESYEDASMRGLCHEGAWECAIGAMRSLNLLHIIVQYRNDLPAKEHDPCSS